ncbi:hypothetical protein JCM3766R1_000494 [Sporobolomyces carnicolor]
MSTSHNLPPTPFDVVSRQPDLWSYEQPLTRDLVDSQWSSIGGLLFLHDKPGEYDPDEFARWQHHWWSDISNKRRFFHLATDESAWERLVILSDYFGGIRHQVEHGKILSRKALEAEMGDGAIEDVLSFLKSRVQDFEYIGNKLRPIQESRLRDCPAEERSVVERRFRGYWRLTGLYLMRHGFQLRRHGKKLLRWSEAQRDKWDKNQEDQPHSDAVAQFFDALPQPEELAIKIGVSIAEPEKRRRSRSPSAPPSKRTEYPKYPDILNPSS